MDGELVRYTAPSVVFELEGRRLEGGGFQPIEAYDVLIANLDPTLERTPPPAGRCHCSSTSATASRRRRSRCYWPATWSRPIAPAPRRR
jgi:hypothetical protein